MKKLIQIISVVLLGSFAITASAKPIGMSYKAVPPAATTVELRRLETIGYDSNAGMQDATQLKIAGASPAQIFSNQTADLSSQLVTPRARPVLITQAMTMQMNTSAMPVNLDQQNSMPAATGQSNDNNLVLPEPPMLLLLALGIMLIGARRSA